MLEPSRAAIFVMVVAFLLSLVSMLITGARLSSGRPLLVYEPRQRVPWGGLAALVALFCVVIAILPLIEGLLPSESHEVIKTENEIDPKQYVWSTLLNSAVMVGFSVFIFACLSSFAGAKAKDLGFPSTLQQLFWDVVIGFMACLASLLPVHAIHLLLNFVFQPKQQHELIEMLVEHRSPMLMLAGTLAAVVVAPLFEEIVFRLMLQGWLERVEDEQIGFQKSMREPSVADIIEATANENPSQEGPVYSYTDLPVNGVLVQNEDQNGTEAGIESDVRFLGLPHGWAPILISGTAFGLAHLGHGVSAFPLVFFGIVLGYLYQRTHRLAPCIAAHMLFNAYTMGLLWLS